MTLVSCLQAFVQYRYCPIISQTLSQHLFPVKTLSLSKICDLHYTYLYSYTTILYYLVDIFFYQTVILVIPHPWSQNKSLRNVPVMSIQEKTPIICLYSRGIHNSQIYFVN